MKKIISLTLILLVVLGSPLLFPLSSKAATSADNIWKYSILNDSTIKVTDYKGDDTDITIPDKIDGYKVTQVYMMSTPKIKSAKIGKDAGKISFGRGCTRLKSIIVNKKNKNYRSSDGCLLNKAGTKLLYYPDGLTAKTPKIPKSVTNIGSSVFSRNKHIKKVIIPDTVKRIERWAFSDCEELTYVKIPKSVKYIGMEAFTFDEYLERVEFDSDGVYSFGNEVFSFCESLKTVTLPKIKYHKTGKYTARSLFWACDSLSKVKLKGASYIPWGCFMDCGALKTVTIPASVKRIGNYAFGTSDCGRYGIDTDYGFVIKGKKNTYAEKYAKKNHYKFKKI